MLKINAAFNETNCLILTKQNTTSPVEKSQK